MWNKGLYSSLIAQINRWMPYFYLKTSILIRTLNLRFIDFWKIFLFLYQRAMFGRDVKAVAGYYDMWGGYLILYHVVSVLKASQIPFASEKVNS